MAYSVIESVTMSEGGFVAIHDTIDGGVGPVIGASQFLEAGTHTDVTVTLFELPGAEFDQSALNESQTLIAMPHLDTNGNQVYEFVSSNGAEDGPYVANGSAVVDPAFVTVEAGAEDDGAVDDGSNVVYYQIDFVVGEPIEELRGPEGTYADSHLIRFAHGSTEEPVVRRAPGAFAYAENNDLAERIESHEITVENGTAMVTFTVADGSEPVELSLVSYTKPGPGWSPETEHLQEFVDAETDTFGPGTYTLTVELPGEFDEE